MSTQDIPDNELDDFFKKSLKEPHIAFEEEAWAKMEQKMEKSASQQAFFRRLFYSLLLLLGTFTGIVTWYILDEKTSVPATDNFINKQIDKGIKRTEIETKEATQEKDLAPLTTGNNNEQHLNRRTIVPDEQNTSKQLSEAPAGIKRTLSEKATPVSGEIPQHAVKNQPNADSHKGAIINAYPEENIALLPAEKSKKSTEKQLNLEQEKTTPPADGNNTTTQTVSKEEFQREAINPSGQTVFSNPSDKVDIKSNDSEIFTSTALSEKGQKVIFQKLITDKQENTFKPIASLPRLSPVFIKVHPRILPSEKLFSKKPLVAVAMQNDTADRQKLAQRRFRPGLSVGLTVSPDMSAVRFSNWDIPGINAGAIAEYSITNKWRLSAGAVYSTKIYKAAGKDYTPPEGFWGSYKIWPEKVDAHCKVLDIPINVRYNIISQERHIIFVSTGLSSYLMLKEDYRYTYGPYVNDKYAIKSWQTKNEYRHFFSVVNFSAGYERNLNNRLSLQAEPYLKLPLAGVGFGKIKLLSTGVFFSLKYKLNE